MLRRAAALAASVLLGACSVVGIRSGTEEPRYDVLAEENGLEIRRYAERLAAETDMPSDDEAGRSAGFRVLARYIFGANQGSRSIAMTAPVAQSGTRIAMTTPVATEPGARMRFFMPAQWTRETLPVPNDPAVRIITVPPETYAVLRYTGARDSQAMAEQQAELLRRLQATPWRPQGAPEAWFYDPPWTLPPLRRNEVVVRVEGAG